MPSGPCPESTAARELLVRRALSYLDRRRNRARTRPSSGSLPRPTAAWARFRAAGPGQSRGPAALDSYRKSRSPERWSSRALRRRCARRGGQPTPVGALVRSRWRDARRASTTFRKPSPFTSGCSRLDRPTLHPSGAGLQLPGYGRRTGPARGLATRAGHSPKGAAPPSPGGAAGAHGPRRFGGRWRSPTSGWGPSRRS